MSNIYTSAEQLIGRTPLLELSHIEKEYKLKAKIIAKLEYLNPAGSVKDRIAKAMIDEAENSGKLRTGSVIIGKHRDWSCCCRCGKGISDCHCYARDYVSGAQTTDESIWC